MPRPAHTRQCPSVPPPPTDATAAVLWVGTAIIVNARTSVVGMENGEGGGSLANSSGGTFIHDFSRGRILAGKVGMDYFSPSPAIFSRLALELATGPF